jgi:hypothetical protein
MSGLLCRKVGMGGAAGVSCPGQMVFSCAQSEATALAQGCMCMPLTWLTLVMVA